jgi:hypothetical protein
MLIDNCLNHLVHESKLVAIDTGVVSAPSDAEHSGNHLMVNCLYHDNLGKIPPHSMLATARSDTLVILKELVRQKMLDGIISVCISFFVNIPPTGRRTRIYRYSIFTNAISHASSALDESFFKPSMHTIQSSQYREIEILLSRERSQISV